MIRIKHNIDESKFKFLWAKYVEYGKIDKHCAQCLKGHWSKKFSGAWNSNLVSQPILDMDEFPTDLSRQSTFVVLQNQATPRIATPIISTLL